MTLREFKEWQNEVRERVKKLFVREEFLDGSKAPELVSQSDKGGYRLEKWRACPLHHVTIHFLLLIPQGVSSDAPVPAVFCIPGSGQSKEMLAAEGGMADFYAREGYVALVVDNPGTGETAEPFSSEEYIARYLLEMGWSWLGYTSAIDNSVLNWLKEQPMVRRDRIIISGFSLGTEPLMVLGNLNPDIYAFVYNDFLCRTLERAKVLIRPERNGKRPSINSIRHLIPGLWKEFDFPDLVAALAPRPVIMTEGGLDRDFNIVREAYGIAGVPEMVSVHHYAAFEDPDCRNKESVLPRNLDRTEYFRLVNVDSPRHGFKKEHVRLWLKRLFTNSGAGKACRID